MKDDMVRTLIYVMILVALGGVIVQLTIENFQLKALRQNREALSQIQVNARNIQNIVDFVNKQLTPQIAQLPAEAESGKE